MKQYLKILLILLASSCTNRQVPENISNELRTISEKWVPDQREGICRIEAVIPEDGRLLIKGKTNVPEAREEIRSYLKNSGVEFYDSIVLLPDRKKIPETFGVVTISVANMKAGPSHSSEMVSQAILGTPVRVLDSDDDWMLVQTPDHYIGWMSDSGFSAMDSLESESWKNSRRIIFTAKDGSVTSVDDGSIIISDIVAGSILENTGIKGDHYIVRFPDGRTGRVKKTEAIPLDEWASATTDIALLSEFALKINGSPYMWGGTSVKAPDCSGFVKTVYFMGGIILARDASLQFLHGKEIDPSSLSNLEPGDLLFFGRQTSSGVKRITHVGFYLGDTKVIHSSGRVRINSLDPARPDYNSYLVETLQGARRIIGTENSRGVERAALHNWYFAVKQ